MPDTLTTITHLINSPPGQLAAGGVLTGIVWKFFERVESFLHNGTKQKIADWLLNRKTPRYTLHWSDVSFEMLLKFPLWLPNWLSEVAGDTTRRLTIVFSRNFDIQSKPVQYIGLVAGALVAVVYWAAVIVNRMMG